MIRSFIFSEGKIVGRDLELEALRLVRADKGLVVWVDLDNPTDGEIKQILEGVFQFHPLAIEDCVTPSDLPKVEDYDEYLFLVTHATDFTRSDKFATTELDLFLGRDFVVTFHRESMRTVNTFMDRLNRGTTIGPRGPDRITHTLLDMLVDNYIPVLDELRSELEDIEEDMLSRETEGKKFVEEILHVRGDFTQLRAIVRPQREMIERLARGENKLIRAKLLPYFRDLRDNLVKLDASVGSYHERLMMAFDIYLNKAAFEANEGIKFLTAVTAVALPALLIGGIFGMNFVELPLLDSPHGPLYALGTILVLTVTMVLYLKKKRWF